jgi:DNA-binding MarR family transcriptional regulator
MARAINNGDEDVTLLERVLQLHSDYRRRLEPIRVTPLQAATLLFLSRHEKAKLKDAAAALRVRPPTLTEVIKDLVRNRWVSKRRSVTDTRVVHLRLSRRGSVIIRQIEQRVRQVGLDALQVNATLTDQIRSRH